MSELQKIVIHFQIELKIALFFKLKHFRYNFIIDILIKCTIFTGLQLET